MRSLWVYDSQCPMCSAPETVGGGVSMAKISSRVFVRSKRYVPCSSQRARHVASRPSSVGFSGTTATTPQGSGAWHMARTEYAAYRPSMPVEGSILGVIGDVFSE